MKGRVIEMSDTANEAGRAKIFACSVLKSEVDTLRRTVNDIHQDLAFADARTNSGRGTRGVVRSIEGTSKSSSQASHYQTE